MSKSFPIRVLVADDSATVRYHLIRMINEAPGLEVVGEARNGEEVIRLAGELRPDVITMDINMPRMDGLEATRQVMTLHPTPVVVVSALIETDIDLSFQAIQAGALAVVEKPPDRSSPIFVEKQRQLVTTLIAMARVKVIQRRGEHANGTAKRAAADLPVVRPPVRPELIAIGASAGGPSALSQLLSKLPAELPVPVVIVQHMAHEFIPGLVRWLNKVSPLEVILAKDNHVLEPGVVNLSPGMCHLAVMRHGKNLITRYIEEKGSYRYQPAVDVLFSSVATVCGPGAIGLVLTGMGDDGAQGLLEMRQSGAHTFAQDEQSSIVFGMPKAAVERGAVERVISLSALPEEIVKLVF